MKKSYKKVYITIFLIALIIFTTQFIFNSSIIDYFKYTEANFEESEVYPTFKKNTLEGAFRVLYSSHFMFEFMPFICILALITLCTKQINMKNNYYIYYIGRNQLFDKKYFKDMFYKATKAFMSIYLAHLLIIIICLGFSIYLGMEMDDYYGIYSNETMLKFIPDNILTLVAVLFLHWIPVYLFMVTGAYLIIYLSQLVKSNVKLFSIVIIYYFLVPSIFSVFKLFQFSPIFAVNSSATSYPDPFLHSILSIGVSLFVVILLKLRVDNYDKI